MIRYPGLCSNVLSYNYLCYMGLFYLGPNFLTSSIWIGSGTRAEPGSTPHHARSRKGFARGSYIRASLQHLGQIPRRETHSHRGERSLAGTAGKIIDLTTCAVGRRVALGMCVHLLISSIGALNFNHKLGRLGFDPAGSARICLRVFFCSIQTWRPWI
jgi:hypothetical protein